MNIKSFKSKYLAGVITLALILPALFLPAHQVYGEMFDYADMNQGGGIPVYKDVDVNWTNKKDGILAILKQLRRQAVELNLTYPQSAEPNARRLKDVLRSRNISEDAYINNVKWSRELEVLNAQKLVELLNTIDLYDQDAQYAALHMNPLGFNNTYKGMAPNEYVLMNVTSDQDIMNNAADEFWTWQNPSDHEAFDPTMLKTVLDIDNTYFSIFGISSDGLTLGVLSGMPATSGLHNEEPLNISGQQKFQINLPETLFDIQLLDNIDKLYVGEKPYKPKASLPKVNTYNGQYHIQINDYNYYMDGEWSVDDPTKVGFEGDKIKGIAEGETDVHLKVLNKTFNFHIHVYDLGSADDYNETIESGATLTLRPQVTAYFNDSAKTKSAEPRSVNWQPYDQSLLNKREGAKFEVKGTLVDKPSVEVRANITVKPATITAISEPEAIKVNKNQQPNLPGTVKVTWSNGDVTDEPVTWDEIPAASLATAPAEITVNGTVQGSDTKVSAKVKIEALTVTKVSLGDTNQSQIDINVDSGTAPTLPSEATITWSDGSTTKESLTWPQNETYKQRAGGNYVIETEAQGHKLKANVTVAPATAGVGAIEPVQTTIGVAPVLPTTVPVTWSNGDASNEPVTWDPIDEAKWQNPTGDSFVVEGTIPGKPDKISLTINLLQPEITKVVIKDQPDTNIDLKVASGNKPQLPVTALVTYNNGQVVEKEINWAPIEQNQYNNRQGGNFTVNGTVEGYNEQLTAKITVDPATITGIANPDTIPTTIGVAPIMPTTVKATWSNGEVTDEPVTWEAIDEAKWKDKNGTEFNVEGSVAGSNQKVIAIVKLMPVVITKIEIADTGTGSTDLKVASGTKPNLPAKARVYYSDNTEALVDINWDALEPRIWQGRDGQTTTINGTVPGFADKLTINLTVEPAEVTAVENPKPIKALNGSKPQLPSTVKVKWSNGDITEEPVVWDELTDLTVGTKTVNGLVKGKPVQIQIEFRKGEIVILAQGDSFGPLPNLSGWTYVGNRHGLSSHNRLNAESDLATIPKTGEVGNYQLYISLILLGLVLKLAYVRFSTVSKKGLK